MTLLSATSPYAKEPRYWDARTGAVFFGPRAPVTLPPAEDDTLHTWREGDRLGLLAHEAWGDAKLWWLLCDLNDVVDPWAIEVGTVLRIPSRARVELVVFG